MLSELYVLRILQWREDEFELLIVKYMVPTKTP
jgi:hypothetical protein